MKVRSGDTHESSPADDVGVDSFSTGRGGQLLDRVCADRLVDRNGVFAGGAGYRQRHLLTLAGLGLASAAAEQKSLDGLTR